jgi:shikimate dehydrogenase
MKPAYLIGWAGSGIQASLTPKMHMEEAEVPGLRNLYQLIDLAEFNLTAEALPGLLIAAERVASS